MFPAPKKGEWEPYRVTERKRKISKRDPSGDVQSNGSTAEEEETYYDEDPNSDEGAVWPIQSGRITNWSCFFALIHHIYKSLNPPFHTPILLITQPVWTPRELEKITQFFFEKFKTPGFAVMDSAQAACYAYGIPSALVVDVGLDKADVTAISDFLIQETGRSVALPDCGGENMTKQLHELLAKKGFSKSMCEQLKKSPICEVLLPGTPLPTAPKASGEQKNPATVASTGADGPGPNQRHTAGAAGDAPRGPGPNTEVGNDDRPNEEENDGVLDVAAIVTSGKMNDILAKKEKEKADRLAARKKGAEAAAAAAKPIRLRNSEKETNTFHYEDYSSGVEDISNAADAVKKESSSMDEAKSTTTVEDLSHAPGGEHPAEAAKSFTEVSTSSQQQLGSREVSVGVERFMAISESFMTLITSAIYRTVLAVPSPARRAELWDSMIVVGNGTSIRGFKEALVASLTARFLISPNSATIFTSELPSNLSTPMATGANTPQYHGGGGHNGPNPLLVAATTASSQMNMGNMQLHSTTPMQPQMIGQQQTLHGSHAQTPTSIKLARLPEYFSEWKDRGHEEAPFLGAQVAAKVIFGVDQGASKGFMTRPDFNEQGPSGIHDYCM